MSPDFFTGRGFFHRPRIFSQVPGSTGNVRAIYLQLLPLVLLHMVYLEARGVHDDEVGSSARDARSAHPEGGGAWAGAWLRDCAKAPASDARCCAGSAGVAVSGAAPAGKPGAAGGRLEIYRDRARRQILPAHP